MSNKLIKKALAAIALSSTFFSYSGYSQTYHDDQKITSNSDNKYSYIFSIDKHMSSDAGGDIALSGIELYRQLDERFYSEDNNFLMKSLGYFTRLYVPLLITTADHEIVGHGGRAREFGIKVTGYTLNLNGTGAAHFSKKKSSSQKNSLLSTGGMQAQHVLAEKIKTRFVESNYINPTYGSAYIFAQMNQPIYIWVIEKKSRGDSGDINSYIKNVNKSYKVNYLTHSKLRNYAYLDFVDPFFYYSLYSYITNEKFEPPMIQFGEVKYLPALRLVLAPYGTETRLVNHVKYDDRYIKLSLSYGKNKKFKTHSIDLNIDKVYQHNDDFSVSLQGAYWSQPKLLTTNFLAEKCKAGGYGAVNSEVKLFKNISGLLSLGYKSNGFMEYLPIKSSLIAKVGIKLDV